MSTLSTPPPNNLDQLIAWLRVWAEDVETRLSAASFKLNELLAKKEVKK